MNSEEKGGVCEVCGQADCAGNHGGHRMWRIMSWKVRAALILALLALALWALVAAVSGIKSYRYIGSGISATNTINVSGSGKVFAVPNIATFTFTVSETGKDVATAQEAVTKKMNDITSYLKTTANIADADIQTTDFSASPKYADTTSASGYVRPNSGTIIGYTVSETVSVKVRDTSKAGDVLSNVGSRGVSNVSSLSFTVDNEEQLQQDARDKAIRDAQGKAEVLAKQLGVSLVRVVGFYENGGPIYYGSKASLGMGAADAAVAPTPANIQVGQNTITSDVSVTYEIQ